MKRMARKARQRKGKAKLNARREQRAMSAGDKLYAMALSSGRSASQPHLVWKGRDFVPEKPATPPKMGVEVTVMHAAHKKFGAKWKGSRVGISDAKALEAIADTGCQTCTIGMDAIARLCPEEYLIPTRHRIVGITDASLAIAGIVFLRIRGPSGTETRQTVYVSKNVKGFYLSESALKELGAIDEHFPATSQSNVSRAQAGPALQQEEDDCSCTPRTATPDRPDTLPFAPTPENIPRLKEWLLQEFAASAFNTCAHQTLQTMTGAPVKVRFKDGAVPHAVHTPIPVPHHWKKQVKADIDRDVRLGIIEPVPQGTPTEWCSRMVVASKKDGTARRTVDLQQLNKATTRETHHTPSPFNLVSTIPTQTRKTVLDAWNGYHSLPLSDEAREATTFITEWGRYRYCRAPMGFHASGDAYTRRFDDITNGVPRVVRIVDDSLIWDPKDDISASFWHAFDYIKLCADNGVVFNRDKFQFAEETVDFAGFEVHVEGFRPPKGIIAAIEQFPAPRNITDIRSWFGLVNQVSYAFAQAEVMTPFRELLASKKRVFYWDEELSRVFEQSKQQIIESVREGVRTFEIDRPTCLATDWSQQGVGFSLTQKHCECREDNDPNCGGGHWKVIFAGSRFTKEAESRYAPIEGEALALVHGLKSCRMFVLGNPNLTVVVDHKPLIKIFNDRTLDTIDNPRILCLKEKALMYQFEIRHIAGEANCTADWMSRNPLADSRDEAEDPTEPSSTAYATRQGDDIESVTWARVNESAACDEECVTLVKAITDGFPDTRDDLPQELRYYWPLREEMYVIGNVPFKGRKMLIPAALRGRVLEGLHTAHQGVTGMQANARERFFWPGLDAAIRQLRAQCKQCNENAPSQPSETMMLSQPPEFPFQHVVTDFAEIEGHDFLVYADRYSGWLEVAKLHNKTWKAVHQIFLEWFAYGVPEEISCDGGPPFSSLAFKDFLTRWEIRRRQSSAYYPQSNGRAEAAVKSARRILLGNINPVSGKLDTEEAARAFLTYRNTPLQDTGMSPAMTLYGRPIRDHLPWGRPNMRAEWQVVADAREAAGAKRQLRSDPRITDREMEPLSCGDTVQVQNQKGNKPLKWYATGKVAECLPNRQYSILIDGSRRVTLRNRKFLRKIDPVCRRQRVAPEIVRTGADDAAATPPAVPTASTPPRKTLPALEATMPAEPARSSGVDHGDTPQRPREAMPRPPRRIVPASDGGEQQTITYEPSSPTDHVLLRRGTRQRTAPVPFSPKLYGQTHV